MCACVHYKQSFFEELYDKFDHVWPLLIISQYSMNSSILLLFIIFLAIVRFNIKMVVSMMVFRRLGREH